MDVGANEFLEVQLLGKPRWRRGSQTGTLENKSAALVAYVAVNGRLASDALMPVLWPGDSLAGARDNLHKHISRLRKATGHSVFDQANAIELARGVDCDVAKGAEDWPTAELLGRSEFLAGIEIPGNRRVNDWIAGQRRHWYAQICDALLKRLEQSTELDVTQPALRLVCRITEMAPPVESAWRARMWLHFVLGDHVAAIDAHRRLAELLAPLGGTPGAQTQQVWRLIELGAKELPSRTPFRARLEHPPVLVGRESQWADMAAAWDTGRPFILLGEGGIGKSRLLRDFVARRGPSILIQGRKGDEHAPYATLGTLLRTVIAEWGLELQPAEQRQVAYALRELGRAEGGAPANEYRFRRAVEAVLGQASANKLRCIAVDDLHYIDLASLQTLRWLASDSTGVGLRFAFAGRPMQASARRDLIEVWRSESTPLSWVEVTPWSCRELEQLLDSLEISGGTAEATAEKLHALTGGNPFLVLDTLTDRAKQAAGVNTAATPPAVLESRVHTVSASAKPLLQLHAVLGSSLDEAAVALGRSTAEATAVAAELEAHGVLRRGQLHDLMRDAVLRSLTLAERRRCHALAAHTMKSDRRVPLATIANTWETAERWQEAAMEYHAAGIHARDAGRLEESRDLLDKASRCFGRAGDPAGRFDAVHDAVDGVLDVHGVQAAQTLVDSLAAWTTTPEQAARVAILNAKVAIGRHRDDDSALRLATAAVVLAAPFAKLHGRALTVQALGLAQARDFARAIDTGTQAMVLSEQDGSVMQGLENASNLVYVYFQASRVSDAISLAQDLVGRFEAAGDFASSGSMEGGLASLLVLSGNPEGAIGPGFRAHERHREVEVAANGPNAVNNRCSLGSAYTHVGRFGEALNVLTETGEALFERIPPLMAAKLRLTQAHVWLLLGADEMAIAALGDEDDSWSPSMQVRRQATFARAARIRGENPTPHLRRMEELRYAHRDIPQMNAPWLEWSSTGDARVVADEMIEVERAFTRAGCPGIARTAILRRIARLNELNDAEAISLAGALAHKLQPLLTAGLQVWVYLPEAWWIVSQALERVGDKKAASACLVAARHWTMTISLPNVPPALRESFLTRNPTNRTLLDKSNSAV